MRITKYTKRMYRAALLGFAALLLNGSLTILFGDELKIHLGNIFIFASIISLGAWSGIVSVLVGSLPFSLYVGSPGEVLRLLLIATTVGLVTSKNTKLNATSLVVLFWLIALGPVDHFLLTADQRLLLPLQSTWILWSDTLCSTIAGLFLLSTSIWCHITEKPRHVPLTALSSHIISAVALTTLYLGFSWASPAWMSSWNLALWIAGIQIVAASGGFYIAQYIVDNFHSLSRDTLRKKEDTSTFSGLASEYWRRKAKTEKRASTSRGIWRRPQQLTNDESETLPTTNDLSNKQGVCVLDVRGTIYFANKPFVELVGIKTDDFISKRIDSLGVSESWYHPLVSIVQETMAQGPRFKEIKFNSLPDKLKYYEISSRLASPDTDMIASETGDTVIVSIRDITDRRTIGSGVLKAQRLESVGALMNGLAHDFNNSLTTIAARASLALNEPDNRENSLKTLQEILDFTKCAGQTVQGLLDFTDRSGEKIKNINLGDLVNTRIGILRKLVGANFDLVYTPSLNGIGAVGNPILLEQALTNLILHAKRAYGEGGGEIKIKLELENIEEEASSLPLGVNPGKFSRLRVEHSGKPMNRNVIARAFDPANSGSNVELGLSIVFAIARAHDGFLTAESHPHKGTVISIYLPYVEPEDSLANTGTDFPLVTEQITHAVSEGQKILVVEDEPTVRELTGYMLTELGYHVVSCDNGDDAVNLATKDKFDLVLVDFVIPKLAGNDLIHKLKSLNNQCKTLVMTGYGSTVADEIDSLIIKKPFDMHTLASAVQKILTTESQTEPEHSRTNQQ